MIPVMFYPYLYIILSLLTGVLADRIPDELYSKIFVFDFLNAVKYAAVIHLLVLISMIVFIRRAWKSKYSPKELAKMVMIIKLVQIPAYILHFLLGALGCLASVWGIGIIAWAVLIDLLTIAQSGVFGICAYTNGAAKKELPIWMGVVFSMLSFIYCIDVVISVYAFIRLHMSERKKNQEINNNMKLIEKKVINENI